MRIRHAPIWRFYRGQWECQSVVSVQHGTNSASDPTVVSPFGNQPYHYSHQAAREFANPLGAFFGAQPSFGSGAYGQRKQAQWQSQYDSLAHGTGPLAQFAQQAAGYLPTVFGQAQSAGQRIASMAPDIYEQLKNQIGSALGQLPGMQQAAGNQTATAQRFLNEAQSPIASQALYQDALRQALEGSRGAAAGRGLLDAGAAQQGESEMGRDLASQFAARRFQEQQGALGGVQNALGAQAGLLPIGAQLAGMQGQGLQELSQALQAGYQLPQQALQQVYQQLAAFQDPRLALLQLTAPQVAQSSRSSGGGGFGILSTTGSKYPIVYWKGF